jgi:predicted GIY-YIG superfamily endonuclease
MTEHGIVYVLELEHNKYYVGHTKERDLKRILDHGNTKNSAQWTKIYKPLRLIKTIAGSTCDEDRITLHAMEVYGWQNVRGGKWCRIELANPPKEFQQNKLLTECDDFCLHCMRRGHLDKMCLWYMDKDGDAIFIE